MNIFTHQLFTSSLTRALLFLSLITLSACTSRSDVSTLQAQVQSQNQTIQSLNAQLSGVQPAQADTWSQLQTLKQEIATLRGSVESMQQTLEALPDTIPDKQTFTETIAIHERALRLTEAQLGLDLQLENSIDPDNPTIITAIAPVAVAPTVAKKPATTSKTPAPAKKVSTEQALYDAGLKSFNDKQYDKAVNAFTDFIKNYPKNSQVANAYYWQGESYYQLKNYAAAAMAYENVISKHSKSNRAPTAYLKQGMCFAALNRKDAAKERYNQLIAKYPKASEATRAKQLIKEL